MSSANTESLTQRWLRQNIQAYPFKDVVYAHVDSVLTRWPSIRPKTDIYTYDDGRTQLLLCLHGLLPIFYRGTPYNIPIATWVTKDYPRLPPIAYVVPTQDMLVRSGKYMDVSGKCGIEYIQHWQRKHEGCNLSALFEAMQDHFSREPPVYARPKESQSPPPQPLRSVSSTVSPGYSERPPPPIPTQHTVPSTSLPVSIAMNDDPPPVPRKPPVPTTISVPSALSPTLSPQGVQMQLPSGVGQADLTSRPPPPLPPHPPSNNGIPQNGISPPIPARYLQGPYVPSSIDSVNSPAKSTWSPDAPDFSTGSYGVPSVPYSQDRARNTSLPTHSSPPLPLTTRSISSTGESGILSHQRQRSPPPVPLLPISPLRNAQPQPKYPNPPPPPPFVSPQSSGIPYGQFQQHPPQLPLGTPLSSSVPVPDLLDGDDLSTLPVSLPQPTAAPPRPPNPELLRLHAQVHAKITSELASVSQVMSLDAERYRAQQSDLLAGEPAIRDEMGRLEAVRDVCITVATRLRSVVQEAETNIAELKRKGDPEVDELVCSTTIVHNQLINLIAEDNAIEDTIYHLHRALNAGRIDLERFLRTTRVLAEEQFMKRALIEKINTGIPMGGSIPMSISF